MVYYKEIRDIIREGAKVISKILFEFFTKYRFCTEDNLKRRIPPVLNEFKHHFLNAH